MNVDIPTFIFSNCFGCILIIVIAKEFSGVLPLRSLDVPKIAEQGEG